MSPQRVEKRQLKPLNNGADEVGNDAKNIEHIDLNKDGMPQHRIDKRKIRRSFEGKASKRTSTQKHETSRSLNLLYGPNDDSVNRLIHKFLLLRINKKEGRTSLQVDGSKDFGETEATSESGARLSVRHESMDAVGWAQ